jgi:hypothetical protein
MKKERFELRLTQEERASFKSWVNSHNNHRINGRRLTESFLIRALIRWFIGLDFPIQNNQLDELRKLRLELSSMGANLNQLAKAYNEGLISVPLDSREFFDNLISEVKEVRLAQHRLVAHIEKGLDSRLKEIFND